MSQDESKDKSARILVEMAGLRVSQDPGVLLCTHPLGAGLGVAIYDPVTTVGGVLHSLLPVSSLDLQWAANHPGMFLDTGLDALLSQAQKLNATRRNLRICVAGGAQIMDEHPSFNVGKSNFDFLEELLGKAGVTLVAQNVGGKTTCSLELNLATGEVKVKFSGEPEARTLCKP